MSKFVVSARKYRPARFDEVVGQSHVSQTLKNALQNDHLAHAFLFCGPRGVGKTTCARILAKVLNCQNRTSDYEPCNTCNSCESFNGNASFNITELDAASNNSVDHIRSLVEQVRFQPQQGEYKVFIIDEVHMLSQAAFNAFLKTLEEPPPYAIFILATTEKHKIIPTILSRCQIFDFRRIQVQDIVPYLQDICQKEGIEADPDALHIIAQKADGALRDALSIFDRIVSFSGKAISYDDVINNLNILDYDYYFKVVDALLASDIASVLLTFDAILRKGFEADIFINGLAEHLRNILVSKDANTLQLLEVSDSLRQKYGQQAQLASTSFLLSALSLANDCDVNYKMARNKRLHTEMAIIKMAHIAQAVDLSQRPIAAIAEKKNPEPSKPKIEKTVAPAVPPSPQKEATPTVQQHSAATPVPTTPKAIQKETTPSTNTTPEPPITHTPAVKENQAAETTTPKMSLAARLGKGVPKLSLDAFEQEVKKEANQPPPKAVVLSLENVQKIWKEYSQSISSKAVRLTMEQADLRLEGQQIVVVTGSKRSEGHIRDEYELMAFLREKLQSKTITLSYEIDAAKSIINTAPPKPKALTAKEKFNIMKEQNPLVEDIYKQFGFQLED